MQINQLQSAFGTIPAAVLSDPDDLSVLIAAHLSTDPWFSADDQRLPIELNEQQRNLLRGGVNSSTAGVMRTLPLFFLKITGLFS